jgi:predicted component of type VI protein secretion system
MNKVLRPQNLKLALVADSGLNIGAVFPLLSERHVLGRKLDAAIPVEDTKVSREHALIDQRNGFFFLVDLGSTNGTYLNGRRVQQAEKLSLGDHVRIGSSVFKVQLLKHVQAHSPTSWHELTRIDMKSAAGPSPVSLSVMEQRSNAVAPPRAPKPRWTHLLERPPGVKLSRTQGLVLAGLGGLLLVAFAIFVQIN